MPVWAAIAIFAGMISLLVLIHEWGHFAAAKLCRVRVDEFGLGFPPRLLSWQRGETRYSINLILLGGFVRMPGENGTQTNDARSFSAHPAWQRAIILLAGPFMNLVAAIALFFIVYAVVGVPQPAPLIGAVSPHSPAAVSLQPGDLITGVDGQAIKTFAQLRASVQSHLGQTVTLLISRQNQTFSFAVLARAHPPKGQGSLGILSADAWVNAPLPLGIALQSSAQQPIAMVQSMAQAVGQLFSHPAPSSPLGQGALAPAPSPTAPQGSTPAILSPPIDTTGTSAGQGGLTGPIGIMRIVMQTANNVPQDGIGPLLELMALISANLAILNLVPFPALDGGRLVFLLIGVVRRRGVSPQVEGLVHAMGMAALLLLMMVVSYQDVTSWLANTNL